MLHIPKENCFILVTHIATHTSNVASESRKPRPHENIPSCTHHLVNHTQEVGINVLQICKIHEIVQVADVWEATMERIEKCFVSLVCLYFRSKVNKKEKVRFEEEGVVCMNNKMFETAQLNVSVQFCFYLLR